MSFQPLGFSWNEIENWPLRLSEGKEERDESSKQSIQRATSIQQLTASDQKLEAAFHKGSGAIQFAAPAGWKLAARS
jgi:hypothetical protein